MQNQVSAFIGTDLMMILRVNEIEHLVLFGLVTSGVTNRCHGNRPR
jgi:nicotinamidase-related amidase